MENHSNRIKKIISRESHEKLSQLINEISSKNSEELNKFEILSIEEYFEKKGISSYICPALWILSIYAEPSDKLLKIAIDYMDGIEFSEEKNVNDMIAYSITSYILYKSKKENLENLIFMFSKNKIPRVRLAVAEYLINKKKIQQGINMMIEIMPDIGTDHALSESIYMYIVDFGTKKIKSAILKKIKSKKNGDFEKKEWYEWAANLINSSNIS